jgi:hypothetical protein
MFHQILKRFIDLRTKLDLLYSLENTAPCEVQCEITELIAYRVRLQICSGISKAKSGHPEFLAFLWLCFVTSHSDACYFALVTMLGNLLRLSSDQLGEPLYKADSTENMFAEEGTATIV